MLVFREKSKCKKKYTKYKDGKRHAQYEHYIEYEMYIKWIFSGKSTTKIYEKISDGHNPYKRKVFTLFTHKIIY